MRRDLLPILAAAVLKPNGASVSPPTAPTGLLATVISTSRIDLAWTDNADDETEQRIYRSPDNITFTLLDTIAADLETYSDTTITAGTTYYYKVGAYNAGGEALSSAVSANTLTLSLISYWKLEEASGTREDSVGSNDLSPTNAPTNAPGRLGNAAAFVGASSQQLSVASNATLQSGNIDHAVAAWVYPASLTGLQVVVAKANGDSANPPDGYEWSLYLNGDKCVFLISKVTGGSGNNTSSVTSDATLTANAWNYVEGYYDDAGTLGVVVNGTVKTDASLTVPGTSTGSLRIGAIQATYYLTGRVDEVGFWKRLLTSAERSALYNSGNGFNSFLP